MKGAKILYKNLLGAILMATLMLVGAAAADEVPEGLFLATKYNGTPESTCYVAAYIYDIYTSGPASLYITGFTGPGGRSDYPPNYNICRFAREERVPPGYPIPCDSRYRWRFYAYKVINGTKYYSNWSKEMAYYPGQWYDSDELHLTRTTPPDPIPPYYAEE